MIIENGIAMPMLVYSDTGTPNEESEITRLCVFVETDYDTDGDGKKDLVKAFLQIPKAAADGAYQAAAIYNPTPYSAGTVNDVIADNPFIVADESFDPSVLYAEGSARVPEKTITAAEAAKTADSSEWLYTLPRLGSSGYYDAAQNDYFLTRGFAIVNASGIGTYGSEGLELCGTHLERDSHKCVVEWLAGNRTAYTDRTGTTAVSADWCNHKVAMLGISYGGTIPYEVATTGVEGLETIVPIAGISCWYDYRNSQGVSTFAYPYYTPVLSSFVAGGCYLDSSLTVYKPAYADWYSWQRTAEADSSGNYSDIYAASDYSGDWENIRCSALIVHGLNDFNVMTKQSDLMYRAFKNAGADVKLFLHQDGHNLPYGITFGEELFEVTLNRWFCHYLYGVDNGIEDMAEVTVQSNLDGSVHTFDEWNTAEYRETEVQETEGTTTILSGSYDSFYTDYLKDGNNLEPFYSSLDSEHAAVYTLDLPEESEIKGIPEVHVSLKTGDTDQDNLMVSAVLMDTCTDGSLFDAYLTKGSLGNTLPVRKTDPYEIGQGHAQGTRKEYVQSRTPCKVITLGWMDLLDPDAGYLSSENRVQAPIEPDTCHDYVIYLSPTVYTVEKGHTLKLYLFAADPNRSRLDDTMDSTQDFADDVPDKIYSFEIDNSSVRVNLPLAN